MSHLLTKFSLSSARFNSQTLAVAIFLWCVVLACTFSSIYAQPFNKRQRIFWIIFVIAVPLVGVLAYIPFSFRREDMPHIFLPKSKKSSRRNEKSPVVSN